MSTKGAPRTSGTRPPAIGRAGRATLGPGPQITWNVGHAAAGYVVALSASAVTVGAAVAAGADEHSTGTRIAGIIGLWIGLIGAPCLAARTRGSGSPRADFAFSLRPRDVVSAAVIGVLTQLVVVPVVSWPLLQLTERDPSASARETLGPPGIGRWIVAAMVVIGAPIAEELFFRGLLMRGLARHLRDGAAVIVSAALFAATHYELLTFPALLAAGIVFAVLVVRTGRLGPAIVAHATFNLTTVIVLTA